jgi:hypothetical protein
MKQRKTVDTKLLMSFNPCPQWPFERVKKAVPKRIKLVEFLKNEEIPIRDRVWVALHKEFFSDKELRLLACDIAEKSLTDHKVTDQRSWNAIKVARSFANGEATKGELAAARAAAWAAADAAARAARATARATAHAAAAAAHAAAWAARSTDAAWAANAAANAAASAAAWVAADAAAVAAAWAAADAAARAARAAAHTARAAAAVAAVYNWVCEKLIEFLEKGS